MFPLCKDSRIAALEKEVQSLEDKLMTLQEEGSIHFDRKDKDSVSAREKTLKAEVSFSSSLGKITSTIISEWTYDLPVFYFGFVKVLKKGH